MPAPIFDEQYVQALLAGNSDIERHFFAYFRPLLRARLRSKLRSREFIEDIEQETFLRVLRSVRSTGALRRPERLGAFVIGTLNNVLLESLRSVRRQSQIPENAPEPAANAIDMETQVVTEERKSAVRSIINDLPERDREIIRLIYFEELSHSEVCERVQTSAEYLRVLLHRAKARFRAEMLKTDREEPISPNILQRTRFESHKTNEV